MPNLFDDGARSPSWVCTKCGQPCGYSRRRPMYGHDIADARCFTPGCGGSVFCTADAFKQRLRDVFARGATP